MKQIITLLLAFILLFPAYVIAADTNISLNYVWNSSCTTNDAQCWIPWLATSDGKPQVNLNLLNISAGALSVSGSGTLTNNLTVDTSTLYVDSTNDRVGIGTTTPSKALHVVGSANISSGLNVSNGLIVNSGRVGIGTTSPTALLDVYGTSGDLLNISNGTRNFVINNLGEVRIGTLDNETNLGNVNNPNATVIIASESTNNLPLQLTTYGGGTGTILFGAHARGTQDAPTAVTTDSYLIEMQGGGWNGVNFTNRRAGIAFGAAENWNETANGVYINFRTTPLNSINPATAMRIDPSGNVGIGITTPTSPLHVVKTMSEISNILVYLVPTFAPSAASNDYTLQLLPSTTLDNAGSSRGMFIRSTSISAGKTLGEATGIYIADPVGDGTVTTNYGIYTENMAKGGTDYAAWFGGGNVNMQQLSASQYVKTDGSKNLVSSASFTASHQYAIEENSNLETGDTVCLTKGKVSKCSYSYAENSVGIYMRGYYDFDSITNTRQNIAYVLSIGDSIDFENTKEDDSYISRQTGFGFKVTNEGGEISTGDLLTTSSTPGYLMKQNDNIIRSYTVAKAMQDITFDEEGKAEGIYGFLYGG